MATYTLDNIRGLDLHIVAEPSTQGIRAYGLAFNDDADIVAETDSCQFIDYCIPDVLARIAGELTDGDNGARDASDIWDALEAHGLVCHCD